MMTEVPRELSRTQAPVPPMLEAAIGYQRDARWVAFYWEPSGDEAVWDDGQMSVCGANWSSYLLYTHHPSVAPHLALFLLGGSDEPAADWLLLDREQRVLYAGPKRSVRRVLHDQYPAPTKEEQENQQFVITSSQDLLSAFDLSTWTEVSQPDFAAAMRQELDLNQALSRWLNGIHS